MFVLASYFLNLFFRTRHAVLYWRKTGGGHLGPKDPPTGIDISGGYKRPVVAFPNGIHTVFSANECERERGGAETKDSQQINLHLNDMQTDGTVNIPFVYWPPEGDMFPAGFYWDSNKLTGHDGHRYETSPYTTRWSNFPPRVRRIEMS
uniref:Putative secreted protein n=1 Tax=Anopheles darlingi TaxID=43151 RepID=A0A2M4DE91_ANODA